MQEGNSTERHGGWCVNSIGRRFYPLDPRAEDVDIRGVAHASSLMCRFVGKVSEFYSLAQHAVLCSLWGPQECALELLLHDAEEPQVCADFPSPIKEELCPGYRALAKRWMAATDEALHLGGRLVNMPHAVHEVDRRMLFTEARDLMPEGTAGWAEPVEPFPDRIIPWAPKFAEYAFLQRFRELTEDLHFPDLRQSGEFRERVALHVQNYEKFLSACQTSPLVAHCMELARHGEITESMAMRVAITELVKQNDVYRKQCQVVGFPQPLQIILPSGTELPPQIKEETP